MAVLSAGLHACWNLLVRGKRDTDIFLRMPAIITLLGLGPALLAERGRIALLPAIRRRTRQRVASVIGDRGESLPI